MNGLPPNLLSHGRRHEFYVGSIHITRRPTDQYHPPGKESFNANLYECRHMWSLLTHARHGHPRRHWSGWQSPVNSSVLRHSCLGPRHRYVIDIRGQSAQRCAWSRRETARERRRAAVLRTVLIRVGSRTGAPTLGSGGCSAAFAAALNPAAIVTFPAPATSNVACGFPALRSPVGFVPWVMRPIQLRRLSAGQDAPGRH